MSCYIVEDKHIYYLACVAFTRKLKYEWGGKTLCIERVADAARIAEEMFRENHASYFARDNKVFNIDPVDPRSIFQVKVLDGGTTHAQIVKSIDCLAYQSSDHDGWEKSQAFSFLSALRKIITSNPKVKTYKDSSTGEIYPVGWDDAHWGCCPAFKLPRVDEPPKPTLSPMMQQWQEIRDNLPTDVLLLFRLGDFFELFYADAERATKLLNLTLTHRRGIPMAGIPYHVKDQYIEKLLGHGLSVAIVDQKEPLKPGSKLFPRREVVEIRCPMSAPKQAFNRSEQVALEYLTKYVSPQQLGAIKEALKGEEGPYFQDLICDLVYRLTFAPRTYDQDKDMSSVLCHFHYFKGSFDWFITELDAGSYDEDEQEFDDTQHQAFGLARIHCEEMGYISIQELIENGVELDLHWTPKPILECKNPT